MYFGLHLGVRGPAAQPDSLRIIAEEAELLGFTHLGISDHIVIANKVNSPYPYTKTGKWFAEDNGECLEQLTTLSFIAAATSNIRLLTSVMVLPHRPPILTAKMLNTIDVLSKGRLTVGLGVGWMEEEIALLSGPDFKKRGAAANEYIEAFKILWTDDTPIYNGNHVSFSNMKFFPKPTQAPHPPLWVGGEARLARERAGRLGDGWYPVGNNPNALFDTPERYANGLKDVHEAAIASDRKPANIACGIYIIWYNLGQTQHNSLGNRRSFTGSAQDILRDISAYEKIGLQHLVIGGESDNLDACLQRMRVFNKEIMHYV